MPAHTCCALRRFLFPPWHCKFAWVSVEHFFFSLSLSLNSIKASPYPGRSTSTQKKRVAARRSRLHNIAESERRENSRIMVRGRRAAVGVRDGGQRNRAEGWVGKGGREEGRKRRLWMSWRRRMTAVLVGVHLGCLVWRQAKLRNRDDRVTHSGRMGKPTAPLTLYSSERGGRGAKVSSHLRFDMEYPARNSNSLTNILLRVYCLASMSTHFFFV